jgi:hypothetical protein
MSILNELIKSALKQFKVKKPTNEASFDREPTGDDGWDIINYYSTSDDDREAREKMFVRKDSDDDYKEN